MCGHSSLSTESAELYALQPVINQVVTLYACCFATAGILFILLSIKGIGEYHSYNFCKEYTIDISNLLEKSLCSVWRQNGWQSFKWYLYKDWRL